MISDKDVFIAADHGGFDLKQKIIEAFPSFKDLGAYVYDPIDGFPSIVTPVVQSVLNEGAFGIVICGSGIGVSIAANRHKGIRAALCMTDEMAKLSRQHNNANVLCLGGRLITKEQACEMIRTFLSTEFLGDKYQCRMEILDQ